MNESYYSALKVRLRAMLCLLMLSLMIAGGAIAQNQRTVKGKILDEAGEPLIGAAVKVVGTTTGATTDLDGNFAVKLSGNKAQLEVTYMGYKPQRLVAKDGMVIKLEPEAKSLGDVVVTGMVATDKRLFTGAADKIGGDKAKLDGLADVSRALEGRSAGVSVQNVSGTFGTAPKIRVRGATSILGSSKPLWVVDGVIQEDIVNVGADDLSSGDATTLISSAIAGLNAEDIESFQILKDGSATSIYGAKAMAGVIVITTKKGRKGTSSFSYTGEFTTRLVPSYREFNIMNSQDQMSVYAELEQKGYMSFSSMYRANSSGVYGKMYKLTHQYDPNSGTFALPNTYDARREYLRAAELRNTDWFDELFSPSIMMNHSISMATGTEHSQTYVSLSVMDDPGWMYGSKVRRYTGNFNNTYDLGRKLSITTIGGVSYRNQTAPGTLGTETDAVNGTVSRSFDINPYSYAINSSRTLDPQETYTRNYAPFNIKRELDNNYIELDILDLKLQTELKWKPVRGLTLAALGAIKYATTNQAHKITEHSNQALAYRAMDDATIIDRNSWLYLDPDQPNSLPFTVLPEGGFYNKNSYKMLSYDFRASATYNTEFNGGHILNSYAGIEFNAQDRSRDSFDGWGMQYDSGETPFWSYYAFKRLREKNAGYYSLTNTFGRTNAVFGTATYSYQGRYTLTGTLRYEGSNRLGRSRSARWLPTWNIASAWNVHEEKFFDKALSGVFSHLTAKASYSLTADAGPLWVNNSHVIVNSYTPWRPTADQSESGQSISGYENSDLTYEKKNELNFGLDMGFLKNRISVTADMYFRNNYDLIGLINTSTGSRYGNVATMKSHGFELSVSTKNIQRKNFSWTSDFIFGFNQNEVTDLKTRTRVFDFIYGTGFAREGYPVRGLFSIPFEGLDATGFPIYRIQELQSDGTLADVLVNRTNYNRLNLQERDNVDYLIYEGPSEPTMTGSVGNIFNYKGFRLNLFVTYSLGNKIRLDSNVSATLNDLDATQRDLNNRWVKAGDEAYTNMPVIPSVLDQQRINLLGRAYNVYNYTSPRVADGGFVRMKEISLTYTLPDSWLKGKLLKSASVKLQATNLFLIYSDSKLRGQDPEFFRAGGVSAPVPKQITATLRLGF